MLRSELKVGQTVQAFHPRRFGVIQTGTIVSVGRKRVGVDFGALWGGVQRVPFEHVREVI